MQGHARHHIADALINEHGQQNARALIAAVFDRLAEVSAEPLDVTKGWAMEATKELYRKMLDVGDMAGALKAAKQLLDIASKQESHKPSTPKNTKCFETLFLK